MNFNTGWLFYRGDANSAEEPDYYDSVWEEVSLPHTARLEPKEWASSPNYRGISWYRRHFFLDESYSGEKIFIQFEGVMVNSDVWINGKHLATHYGGYLPFTLDISDEIRFGKDNVIAVKVDSRDDWETPPGKPQQELDFVYFGGIYRDVNLYVTDKLYVTDAIFVDKVADGGVFITYPEASKKKAVVEVKTNVKNDYSDDKNVSVETTIVDQEGNVVATVESESQPVDAGSDYTFVQTLTINNPKLWSMNDPNLHIIYTKIKDGGRIMDDYSTRIGIRRIKFTADEGFFINDKQVLLNGVNHHEDYMYVGNAASASMLYRDVKQIKDAGFNFIRAGHYPHNQAFMDACDELGVAVIVPTPGWQYYTDKGEFPERSIQMTREMIRRDRNHPSVIVWEPILNETWYPEEFAQVAYNAVHEEYPGDQAYAASDFGAPKGEMFDVVYKEANSETKPLITREWGDANHNLRDGERSGRNFGERSLISSSIHRQNSLKGNKWKNDNEEDGYWDWAGLNANPRISGYALWSYNDYNRGMDRTVAYSGIVDRDRYPKFNYYWLQSQRDPNLILGNIDSGPMVFIANYWSESSPRDVNVYSNAEEVKLYVNDRLIETRSPDNVEHIFHPIFTFPEVPWEPGKLKAEALIDGKVVATYTVSTPGEPDHLSIEFDTKGIDHLTADSSDMVMAYVTVRDRNGNIVPTATDSISLHLYGPGVLIGNGEDRVKANPVKAEAGVAPVLIRSTSVSGDVTLAASAEGLVSASAVIESVPYNGLFVPGVSNRKDRPIKGQNVALNKAVTVSSEQSGNLGSNVNDGDPSTLWIPEETQPGQWAKIDLGEDHNILGAEVTWGTSGQATKYIVEVSQDDQNWIKMVDKTRSEKSEQKQTDRFAANARYVRITLTDRSDGYGGVVDFSIFGGEKSSDGPIDEDTRQNITAEKTANASSFSPGNEPSFAVDNDSNTIWRAKTYDVPQWLQVDLDDYYTLTGAKILWGKDSTYYVYKIQVSRDGVSWTDVLKNTTTGSYYRPVDFSAYAARYVRIVVEDLMAGGGEEEVAIRELEIYGKKQKNPV